MEVLTWHTKKGSKCGCKHKGKKTLMAKRGLYANMNARKKAGTSRSKKNSTITPKAYAHMKAGFPKKKK